MKTDKRTQLLKILSDASQSISSAALANMLGTSERTVRNYIKAINEEGKAVITSSREGYRLESHTASLDTLPNEAESRVWKVLSDLLTSKEGVNAFDEAEALYVSSSTILNTVIPQVKEIAKEYDLRIESQKYQFYLRGSEQNRRKMIGSLAVRNTYGFFNSKDALEQLFPSQDIDGIMQELFIVPFSLVSAIPSLWAILRRFVPVLPDISPLSTFSFGLIGLFVVFVIPYNCLQKIEKKDRSMIAGFTGIGAYMMCMNFQTVDGGSLVSMNKFGAGGMFTAMVVGLMVAVIYKLLAKYSFFGEDSVIPDFVKNWFDNIAAILISLTVAYLFTYIAKIDVFAMVQILMKPVTSFAQSAPGVIMIVFLQNVFYFFGVSGWVFTPVTRSITQAAIAENAELVAAGLAPKNIYAYGFSRYHHIGGQGATLPLALFMLRAKSKKFRLLGKATLVPSIFNINEPLQYGAVVGNPFMLIPTVLIAIILPGFSYLWFAMGWGTINYVNFDMNFAPNAVSAFFMSGGDWRNVLLICINFVLAALIWYPFFKAADKAECKKEAEREAAKAAKKAAKAAVKA